MTEWIKICKHLKIMWYIAMWVFYKQVIKIPVVTIKLVMKRTWLHMRTLQPSTREKEKPFKGTEELKFKQCGTDISCKEMKATNRLCCHLTRSGHRLSNLWQWQIQMTLQEIAGVIIQKIDQQVSIMHLFHKKVFPATLWWLFRVWARYTQSIMFFFWTSN